MPIKTQTPGDILANALAHYRDGFDPALIELPEAAVFPGLIPAQPTTARKARTTGSPPTVKLVGVSAAVRL